MAGTGPLFWHYSSLLSLSCASVGSWLLYLGTTSLLLPSTLPFLAPLHYGLLAAGSVLLLFLISWNLLHLTCPPCGSLDRARSWSGCVGLASLLLLLLCLVSLLTATGLLWWTAGQLDTRYQVLGSCFCSREAKNSSGHVLDRLGLCVQLGNYCSVTYTPVQVPAIQGMFLHTARCQPVNLASDQDTDCLQFSDFHYNFLILRVLLPLLVLLLLPALIFLIAVRFSAAQVKGDKSSSDGRGKSSYISDSISWSGLELPFKPSYLGPADPVQFYSDICRPLSQESLGSESSECTGTPTAPPVSLRTASIAVRRPPAPGLPSSPLQLLTAPSSSPLQLLPAPPSSPQQLEDCEGTNSTLTSSGGSSLASSRPPSPLTMSTPLGHCSLSPSFNVSKVPCLTLSSPDTWDRNLDPPLTFPVQGGEEPTTRTFTFPAVHIGSPSLASTFPFPGGQASRTSTFQQSQPSSLASTFHQSKPSSLTSTFQRVSSTIPPSTSMEEQMYATMQAEPAEQPSSRRSSLTSNPDMEEIAALARRHRAASSGVDWEKLH